MTGGDNPYYWDDRPGNMHMDQCNDFDAHDFTANDMPPVRRWNAPTTAPTPAPTPVPTTAPTTLQPTIMTTYTDGASTRTAARPSTVLEGCRDMVTVNTVCSPVPCAAKLRACPASQLLDDTYYSGYMYMYYYSGYLMEPTRGGGGNYNDYNYCGSTITARLMRKGTAAMIIATTRRTAACTTTTTSLRTTCCGCGGGDWG